MENASKALIIAGAILLAIVIISLWLIVVNNVRNTVDTSNLSEQEIQSFNAKFDSYEGSNISGARVNSLIQQVISTNQVTADEGGSQYIIIVYLPSSWDNTYFALTYDNGVKGLTLQNYDIFNSDKDAISKIRDGETPTKAGNNKWSPITNGDSTACTGFAKIPSTSVKTNTTYEAKIYYKNGLVKSILVKSNS